MQVVLVDNSDFNNTTATGTWTTTNTATGLYGHDYATHPAGTGTDSYTWRLNVPQAGSYQVFVHYPQVSGAATDAESYDMGFRDYSPGLNRFLTRDSYNGALADMRLGTNPFTGNRYAFGGGNPISMVEADSHDPCPGGGGGCYYDGTTTEHDGVAPAQPPVIDVETGLCAAECRPINDAVDAFYRENDCQGFTVSNFLGLAGLSPCGMSRDEVQRALLEQVARQQLAEHKPELFLPGVPKNGPDNEEIAERLSRHIGNQGAKHGFGKLSQDEIAVEIEKILDRYAMRDKGLMHKIVRQGQPDEAIAIYDPKSGIMVVVNPSASGFGTALGGKSIDQFARWPQS